MIGWFPPPDTHYNLPVGCGFDQRDDSGQLPPVYVILDHLVELFKPGRGNSDFLGLGRWQGLAEHLSDAKEWAQTEKKDDSDRVFYCTISLRLQWAIRTCFQNKSK